MQKLRYLAYDFNMEDLVKIIFARKGKLLTPAFEEGRILIKESQIKDTKRADLYLMQLPKDEESEASQIMAHGFLESMIDKSIGEMDFLCNLFDKEIAEFTIGVDEKERSKGYGTALMNAGAKYSGSVGIEKIYGTLKFDKEIERRKDFYKQLNMDIVFNKNILASVNDPTLNELAFTTNRVAEVIWNSFA